jgi:hypothetical protein
MIHITKIQSQYVSACAPTNQTISATTKTTIDKMMDKQMQNDFLLSVILKSKSPVVGLAI